jgi:hypothetical protein
MWMPFEGGKTVGQRGSESGKIVLDEEHSLGARITLERDTGIAPFAITCGIYGWMMHTRYLADESVAVEQLKRMQGDLARILEQIPSDSEGDTSASQVSEAISRFVQQYP